MKSRPLSIFLLKSAFNAQNALKDDCNLEEAECNNLPKDAKLFLADIAPLIEDNIGSNKLDDYLDPY